MFVVFVVVGLVVYEKFVIFQEFSIYIAILLYYIYDLANKLIRFEVDKSYKLYIFNYINTSTGYNLFSWDNIYISRQL